MPTPGDGPDPAAGPCRFSPGSDAPPPPGLRLTSRTLHGSAAPGFEVPASSHWAATAEGKA